MHNIEDNDVFLLVAGGKQLFVYMHNKKDTREVDFGEDGLTFVGEDICNVQVASNNKFFMVGVPSKRAIGFFGFNRVQLNTKPLKWVTKVSLISYNRFKDFVNHTFLLLYSTHSRTSTRTITCQQ